MKQDLSDTDSDTASNGGQPVKIRKKPGRKPNPASPALRKAQNRAAQRAFRERKERHMRELEVAIKQIREQRDKLHVENEQLKADQEIMRSENWYLKGIVLTLQLVCFQHNLVIPQHGPYINEQALSVLAQSIPESISTYISVNANNKLPIPSKLFGYKHTMKQRDRYLSTGSIVITKEGIHSVPDRSSPHPQQPIISKTVPVAVPRQREPSTSCPPESMYDSDFPTEDLVHPLEAQDEDAGIPPLSPGSVASDAEMHHHHQQQQQQPQATPRPVMLTEEPITSNLAAIQTLRLRLRLQSACVRMDSIPFAIQPTILQLTIPHDPRIDLIPTPHMRDRMILFRDQFDLDDCFRCLLGHSVFHGGDPAIAANWQLPPEFFEKYWFLTIDYDLRRTTNHWRRLQGLSELDFKQQQKQQQQELKRAAENDTRTQPLLEQTHHQNLNHTDISALLGIDFWKIAQRNHTDTTTNRAANEQNASYASSLSSDCSYNTDSSPLQAPTSPTTVVDDDPVSSFEPVRLTNGYSFSSFAKPQQTTPAPATKKSSKIHHHHSIHHHQQHKTQRHHPYHHQSPSSQHKKAPPATIDPWDTLLVDANAAAAAASADNASSHQDYDLMMDNLIDSEQAC
ncbi:hypothetical protein FB192DRAFT_1425823 [Mucor lusitanicus]|uniref:BZIP domain-containing protein n=1 Tax=Mucor circinelloides f. lusitanicus TaxID=29924 RepID=A0A8H4BRF9_MUCCL|nr:hypothetical protein FB192DRAFT_1425823 [Mucor lusitanicus]